MRSLRLALVLPIATLALVGCSPGSEDVTSTPSPVATASAAPTATETPSASADPAPQTDGMYDPTCENILNTSAYDQLAADGLESTEFLAGEDAWGSELETMLDEGGIVCQWSTPSTGTTRVIAYAPLSAEDRAERIADLQAEGWTEQSGSGGLLFTSADPADATIDRPFLFTDVGYFSATTSAQLAQLALG
ncbi:hypothetical protein HQQ81_03300 [Microbacteriaceae bacterium VKM Ac-2854]|nr:hypothetical protein [Microbacteriaceae bacterium VKM Ac-2854]